MWQAGHPQSCAKSSHCLHGCVRCSILRRFSMPRRLCMSLDLDHVRQVMEEADCLYTQPQVETAMYPVAHAITEKLKDKNPIVYSVMNGCLIIAGQLQTRLNCPMEVGYLPATRYRN